MIDLMWACFFCWLTAFGNSLCDAIKFSKVKDKYDFLWHCIKYGLDRPAMFGYGLFSYTILKEFKDFWHYNWIFVIWCSFTVTSFIIWQINYRCWRRKFDK